MCVTTALFGRKLHTDSDTIASYTRDLRALAAFLGGVGIQAATPDNTARFILIDVVQRQSDGTPKAAISVNHVRTATRMFFRYLVETGMLDRSPAAALKVGSVGTGPVAELMVEVRMRRPAPMGGKARRLARKDCHGRATRIMMRCRLAVSGGGAATERKA